MNFFFKSCENLKTRFRPFLLSVFHILYTYMILYIVMFFNRFHNTFETPNVVILRVPTNSKLCGIYIANISITKISHGSSHNNNIGTLFFITIYK